MAHMYPVGGPTNDTTSDAERRIYDLLACTLDDDYHVFHSVPWTDKQKNGRVENGEIDFVVLHPDRGILLIEVKGGGIDVDWAQKAWISEDRYAQSNDIKDPFQQASKAAHQIKRHLTRVAETKPYAKQYWLSYAVWFPNIEWRPGSVPLPHVRDDLVLDSKALVAPEEALRRLLQNSRPQGWAPMTQEALNAIVDVLAPKRTIKPLLRDHMRANEQQFIQLTDTQYKRLSMLYYSSRVAVRGPAGTGKTVLGLEAARRFAEQELDVLIVCVNSSLASWIAGTVHAEPEHIRSHITIMHVSSLLQLLIAEANQTLGRLSPDDLDTTDSLGPHVTQARLGSLFARCVTELEQLGKLTQFDAIIVDEAQDIERPIWVPLHKLLRDRRNGRFIAFYDPSQRLDEGEWSPPMVKPYRDLLLTDNCRNAEPIYSVALQFYTGQDVPLCMVKSNRLVECLDPHALAPNATSEADREVAALEKVLNRLIDKDGVAPQSILVVTCRSQKASALYSRHAVGKHKLSSKLGTHDMQSVRVVTVRAAKGLEADVVIVCELAGVEGDSKRSNHLYVATSRPKHHLIVMSTKEAFLPRQPALVGSLYPPMIA